MGDQGTEDSAFNLRSKTGKILGQVSSPNKESFMSFAVTKDESTLYAATDGDESCGIVMYSIDKNWVTIRRSRRLIVEN